MENVSNNEQKTPTIDEMVDQAFEGQEAPLENTPAKPQTEEPKESVTDTPKTEAPESEAESFEGVDKGFANHPAWVKQREKLKEAQEEAKALSSLLDDPVVFKRHLERQGYSKQEIAQVMRERGFQEQPPQEQNLTSNEQEAFIKSVCQKKGWNYNNLKEEEKAYITDLIGMTDTVFDLRSESLLSKRLKPLEDRFSQIDSREKATAEMSQCAEISSKYNFDFDKDILPAIGRELDKLSKLDPLNKQKFDVIGFTKDLILQLVEERGFQQVRRDSRTELKKGSKPLKPGAFQPSDSKPGKGKTVSETVDSYFENAGLKG